MLGTYWGGRRAELYALKFHGWFFGEVAAALSHFVLFRPPRCRGFQCIRSVLHTRGGYMIARSSRAGRGNIQVVHPVPMFFSACLGVSPET